MAIATGKERVIPPRSKDAGLPGPISVMDRDENSAHNILARFLARRGPYTGDPVRCTDVFTATEYN
jgi:hypothetical protein